MKNLPHQIKQFFSLLSFFFNKMDARQGKTGQKSNFCREFGCKYFSGSGNILCLHINGRVQFVYTQYNMFLSCQSVKEKQCKPPLLNITAYSDLMTQFPLGESSQTNISKQISTIENASSVFYDSFEKKFQLGEAIGEGANGVVYEAINKKTLEKFAAKKIKTEEEHVQMLKQNFRTVCCLKHPNIVGYKTLFIEHQKRVSYLLMELKQYPSLSTKPIYPEKELRHIARQLLQALEYMHSQKFYHRDIKPDNILYDQKSQKIYLIDFGVSKRVPKNSSTEGLYSITGTCAYRAPEMKEGKYNQKVDIWSLGLTLYELVCGKMPFSNEKCNFKPEFIGKQWEERKQLKDFLKNLISYSVQKRFSASEALKHVWLSCEKQLMNRQHKSLQTQRKILKPLPQSLCEQRIGIFNNRHRSRKQQTICPKSQLVQSEDEGQIYENGQKIKPF